MTRAPSSRRTTIALPEGEVEYLLRRDPRRRRLCLLVTGEAAVELRAPLRAGQAEIDRFLRGQGEWLRRQLDAARHRLAARPALGHGSELPFLDRRLRLEVARGGRSSVRQVGDTLLLAVAPSHEAVALEALLEGWYRSAAHAHFAARLAHFAPRIGVEPRRLTIRGQRSRWGSCSSRGAVSLNWRLLFAPAAVADYVVVHELCHLRHLDHSPAFWALVAAHDADFHRHRQQLRTLRPPF